MHDKIVDTAGFFVFFVQARQSRSGEVTWKLESCYRVKICLGENDPEANVFSGLFSPKRDNFRSSKVILAQARVSSKLNPKK